MLKSVLVISAGASAGALLRWFLGTALNSFFPLIPLGTLVANLLGGYLVGLAISVLAASPGFSPEWRLLIITGFLGALTTFSTFSAEVTGLLLATQYAQALIAALLHLLGSLAMTVLGVSMVRLWL